MRVITGLAGGRKLVAPVGDEITRPTSDMTKEAMFSIIQFEIENSMVLDLFAGSGQLGIEALSRGARKAVFIDNNKEAHDCIIENLKTTKLFDKSSVSQSDVMTFLSNTKDKFDFIFMDPPYCKGYPEKVLPLASKVLCDGGAIIVETEKKEVLPQMAGTIPIKKEYHYGKAKLTLYRETD